MAPGPSKDDGDGDDGDGRHMFWTMRAVSSLAARPAVPWCALGDEIVKDATTVGYPNSDLRVARVLQALFSRRTYDTI